MSQENDNKRIFPRVDIEISVEVNKIPQYPPEKTGEIGVSKNISGRGMCLNVSLPYKSKSLVSLNLGMLNFAALGEVAWCRKLSDDSGYDIGVEFRPRNFGEAKKLYSVLHQFLNSDK